MSQEVNGLLCNGLTIDAQLIHDDNRRKGFWDAPRANGTLLMLCVSELSEALEADRKGRHADMDKYLNEEELFAGKEFSKAAFERHIKDTFEDELADTMIRLLDLCGAHGIDIEWHINKKLEYNRSREYKHGKAY